MQEEEERKELRYEESQPLPWTFGSRAKWPNYKVLENPLGLELETDGFLLASTGKRGMIFFPTLTSTGPCEGQKSLTSLYLMGLLFSPQPWVPLAFQFLGTERGSALQWWPSEAILTGSSVFFPLLLSLLGIAVGDCWEPALEQRASTSWSKGSYVFSVIIQQARIYAQSRTAHITSDLWMYHTLWSL